MGLLNVYGLSQATAGIKIMTPHSHNKHWNEKGKWQSIKLVWGAALRAVLAMRAQNQHNIHSLLGNSQKGRGDLTSLNRAQNDTAADDPSKGTSDLRSPKPTSCTNWETQTEIRCIHHQSSEVLSWNAKNEPFWRLPAQSCAAGTPLLLHEAAQPPRAPCLALTSHSELHSPVKHWTYF